MTLTIVLLCWQCALSVWVLLFLSTLVKKNAHLRCVQRHTGPSSMLVFICSFHCVLTRAEGGTGLSKRCEVKKRRFWATRFWHYAHWVCISTKDSEGGGDNVAFIHAFIFCRRQSFFLPLESWAHRAFDPFSIQIMYVFNRKKKNHQAFLYRSWVQTHFLPSAQLNSATALTGPFTSKMTWSGRKQQTSACICRRTVKSSIENKMMHPTFICKWNTFLAYYLSWPKICPVCFFFPPFFRNCH